MKKTLLIIEYRIRYYWKKVAVFCGFCPKCYSTLNYSHNNRAHCPHCGKFI